MSKDILHIPHDIDGSSQSLGRAKLIPKVGQNVIYDGKQGTITKVIEPDPKTGVKGKFFVDLLESYYLSNKEFYYSDYNTIVIPVEPIK